MLATRQTKKSTVRHGWGSNSDHWRSANNAHGLVEPTFNERVPERIVKACVQARQHAEALRVQISEWVQ